MKHKRKRKFSVVFLVIATMVASFPVFNTRIEAAELPDVTQFATVNELKQFNTDNTDNIENAAKIHFGNDNLQWWIAGSQHNNLTLFAAKRPAQATKVYSEFSDKTDEYEYNGETVNPNHYGGSTVRKKLISMATDTKYFSSAEQSLMNKTTVYTGSARNGVYATTDTLYLPYGDWGQTYVTVGTNDRNHLNNGLRVYSNYWCHDDFWLRTPNNSFADNALRGVVYHSKTVDGDPVYWTNAVAPAFELKVSSVLFASAVPAVNKEGVLTLENTSGDGAFTLRYQPQTSIGNATYSKTKQSITISGITNDNTYLVVQNKDGAWSKKVKNGDVVLAKEMNSTLASFENCKVWLETTDTTNRMTYASEPTQGNHLNVKIIAGEHLSLTNGAQTNVNGIISPITVTVEEGYYLPEHYGDSITGWNGLTITNQSLMGFTITGIPTSDVYIELLSASEKTEQPAPTVIGGIGTTINGTTSTMEYATSETSVTWTTCDEGNTEVSAGTWYVRYKETATQKASPITSVTVIAPTYTITTSTNSISFDTKNEGYDISNLTKDVTITNTGNSNVTLVTPTSSNYDVSLSTNELDPKEKATLRISPKDDLKAGTYDETMEVKTTENTTASVNVSFTVNGTLTLSLDASATSIIEGESVTLTASASGGSGNYTYTWYANDTKDTSLQGDKVHVTPAKTTTYKVEITDTIEYKSAVATITVKEQEEGGVTPTDPEKPNIDKPSTEKPKNNDTSVETGDPTNRTLWITLFGFSSCILLVYLYRRKKQIHNRVEEKL